MFNATVVQSMCNNPPHIIQKIVTTRHIELSVFAERIQPNVIGKTNQIELRQMKLNYGATSLSAIFFYFYPPCISLIRAFRVVYLLMDSRHRRLMTGCHWLEITKTQTYIEPLTTSEINYYYY